MLVFKKPRLGAAAAFLCLFAAEGLFAQDARQLKPGERELYDAVLKSIAAAKPGEAVTSLETWTQRYPDSDYKDDRAALYVQTYGASNQPAKALDAAGELISRDIETAFPGAAGQGTILRLLYSAVWAITQIANPTPQELAAGDKAARMLTAYDRQLPGVTAEKWAEARTDMKEKAQTALLYIAMLPGIQAMAKQPPDCAAAESAYTKALADYPGRTALSYELGRALSCEAKVNPDKRAPSIYHFVRAAVIDPALGNPANDPKKIQAFADKAYVTLHGSEEGLDRLKQLVRLSPLPPPDFTIATASEITARADDAARRKFEQEHPQLALWGKIRAALSDSSGEQYFESQLKDSAVPRLTGTLLSAKPACHPKELTIAVPLPDSTQPLRGEITLKLEKPLAGQPDLSTDLEWEGVPSGFTKEPFMLTMEGEPGKVQGLKMVACGTPKKR
jgi:hypothetical protein